MDYTKLKWLEETRMYVDWTHLAQDPVTVTEPSYGYGMPFKVRNNSRSEKELHNGSGKWSFSCAIAFHLLSFRSTVQSGSLATR